MLKERLFGLTSAQGNHGEDVKEYYFYLDNVPSHAYMKYLYKYPQQEFPYKDLIETNKKRDRTQFEYELIDTKIFDEDRYFDVFVEYAKEDVDDILIKITIFNRALVDAPVHVLPTVWFRNTWSWEPNLSEKPVITLENANQLKLTHSDLGTYFLYAEHDKQALFTENETNNKILFF